MNVSRTMLLTGLLLAPLAGHAGDIQLSVETPAANENANGIDVISGWAVSSAGIEKIELYLNGDYVTDLPYGLTRTDVRNVYPSYPGSEFSGFAFSLAYSLLPTGAQTLLVRAIDEDGATKDTSVPINVQAFHKQFFSDASAFDVSSANFVASGRTLQVNNMLVEGQSYNVTLEWQDSRQGFHIVDIDPVN